ncbi:MAG: hypothetical protein AB7E61_07085 [Acholeplasmataceae bacterium]
MDRVKGKDLVAGMHSIKDEKGNVFDILCEMSYYGFDTPHVIVYDRKNDKECYKQIYPEKLYRVLDENE